MEKYYRVLKDTPIWDTGAIIKKSVKDGKVYIYGSVEDVWHRVKGEWYEASDIIESPANAEFFERVYKDKTEKALFVTADKIKESYNKIIK